MKLNKAVMIILCVLVGYNCISAQKSQKLSYKELRKKIDTHCSIRDYAREKAKQYDDLDLFLEDADRHYNKCYELIIGSGKYLVNNEDAEKVAKDFRYTSRYVFKGYHAERQKNKAKKIESMRRDSMKKDSILTHLKLDSLIQTKKQLSKIESKLTESRNENTSLNNEIEKFIWITIVLLGLIVFLLSLSIYLGYKYRQKQTAEIDNNEDKDKEILYKENRKKGVDEKVNEIKLLIENVKELQYKKQLQSNRIIEMENDISRWNSELLRAKLDLKSVENKSEKLIIEHREKILLADSQLGKVKIETLLLAKILGIDQNGMSLDKLITKVKEKIKSIENLDRILNQRKDFIVTQKTKIANGKTGEVILNMIRYAKKEKEKILENEFLSISNRYKTVNKKKNQNTISEESASLEISKINKSVIDFLSELEEEV